MKKVELALQTPQGKCFRYKELEVQKSYSETYLLSREARIAEAE